MRERAITGTATPSIPSTTPLAALTTVSVRIPLAMNRCPGWATFGAARENPAAN